MDKYTACPLSIFICFYGYSLLCPNSPHIDHVRFFMVCLCLVPSFFFGNPKAMFLTVWADFAFLFLHQYELGILLFCLVHCFYLEEFLGHIPTAFYISLPLGLLLPLVLFACLYIFLFGLHITLALELHTQKKAPPLGYLFGLCCFAIGDALLAIGYFTTSSPLWIWLFYAPSQMLLAFTAKGLPLLQWFFLPRPTKG